MSLRFWRRFKIIPGVKINAHKSGLSLSVGPQGGQLTVGQSGVRVTGGLRGTGLFLSKKIVRKVSKSNANSIVCEDKVEYKMLESFMNAIDHLEIDNIDEVITILSDRQFNDIADVHNLLGWMYIQNEDYDNAIDAFTQALKMSDELGDLFDRLKMKITYTIPMQIGSEIEIDLHGDTHVEQVYISWLYAFHIDYLTKENLTDADMTESQVRQKLYKFYQSYGGVKSLTYALDIAIANDDHKDKEKAEEMLTAMAGIEDDFFITLFRAIVANELDKKQTALDFASELIRKKSIPLELRLKARGLRAGIYDDWEQDHLASKDREWIETMAGK